MATDVKIPEGFRLVSNTPSIPAGYKLVSTPEITPEIKAKVDANNAAYAQKSAELNKEYPFVSLVENKPESLGAKIARPIARGGLLAMQGVANAGFNPAGYVAREAGIDTAPVKPENWVERGIERSGEYGYDAAVLYALASGGLSALEASSVGPTLGKGVLGAFTEGGIPAVASTSLGAGMARGYLNPRNEFEGFLTDIVGSSAPGAISGAIRKTTSNVAGGLKNILSNNKANAKISKGIRASEEVAQRVASDAPEAYNALNDKMANILDDSLGRKVDIERALDSQQQRYNDFISKNADVELYSPKSAQEQSAENFNRWLEGSKVVDENGQPLKLYHQTGADFDAFEKGLDSAGKYDYETPSGFFFKSNNADIGLQGKKQIPVYIKGKKGISFKNRDEARKYFRENIEGYDDLLTKYNNVDNEYLVKEAQREAILDKRIDNLEKSPAYMNANEATQMKMREDVINSLDDDAFFNEWRDAVNKYASQMKNKINDYIKENNIDFMRLENDSGSIGKKATDAYIVFNPNQIKSVNNSGAWSSSPSLSDAGWTPKASLKNFTQGLNEYQEKALNQALNKGATMSTNEKGSLGATHRAQEVLNDMIDASYDTSVIGQRRPTTETSQLMTVKERLNQILEPSGVKPYDAGISKAKGLRDAFEKGYKFKPSEIKLEKSGLKTLRDKKSFLQGYVAQIEDNVLSDGGTNLAEAVQKSENVFKKLLPKAKFENLKNNADELATQFKRLKSLEGQANNRLVKETEVGSSIQRENLESKGAMIGRALDILTGSFNRRGNRRMALQYLNPETTAITERGGLKGLLKGGGSAGIRQLMIDLLNGGN